MKALLPLWTLCALVACSRGEPAVSQIGEAQRPATAGSGAGADLCEHGVLASLCPKCNPKLAAVFQAKGDWCEEHGFPESFCPICHPERGGRPSVEVKSDGAPADGTKVHLKTAEDVRLAGIRTTPAARRPGGAHLAATATLSFDATLRAEVNAPAPGVIRSVSVEIGSHVKAGDALAVVESAAVGADQGRLLATEARLHLAESTYEREAKLLESGVSSRRDVLAAQQEVVSARADLAAGRSALGMVGRTQPSGRYTITAPLEGTVIRREATIGRFVGPEDPLFEVADTRTLWAEIDLAERQAARVQIGQKVLVTVDDPGLRPVDGEIQYIAPEVDRRTRTVRARATLPNPDGRLRANMFARADVALGAADAAVLVPRTALQRAKSVELVFVQIAANEFEARRVKVGVADADSVEVLAGVKAGEAVATDGSFLLKTETLKGSIGAGCCDGD